MGDKGQNQRWIIIVDKSPRGPLTEIEIKTLIKQSLVRLNDIAFRVEGDSTTASSQWKFLWQFKEFDRRQEPGSEATETNFKKVDPSEDRRNNKDPEKLEKEFATLLPSELSSIRPEDLAFGPKVRLPPTEHERLEDFSADLTLNNPRQGSFLGPVGIYGALGTLLLGFIGYHLLQGEKAIPERANASINSPAPQNNPENQNNALTKVTRPNLRIPPTAPHIKATATPPTAPELSDEEYQRKREQLLDKEREEEDERRNTEFKDSSEDEEAVEAETTTKLPLKKKRRPAREETSPSEESPNPDEIPGPE